MAKDMKELSWDEHAGFMRRLGQSLLRKEAQAGTVLSSEVDGDDLVQDAWLLAAERMPPSHPDPGGWLRKVIANLVRERKRASVRRARREAAVARGEGQESQDALAERVELVERVSAAVLELREPLRTVIHLRYYEDLTPTEIARRLDVPLENVRTRLRRGRDFLRERLDRSYRSQQAWLLPLAALIDNTGAPAPVIADGGEGSAISLSTTYKTAVLAGVLGSMQAKLAVVLGLATGVGIFLWTRTPATPPLPELTQESRVVLPITEPGDSSSLPITREASVERAAVPVVTEADPEPTTDGPVIVEGTLSIFAGENLDLVHPRGTVRVLERARGSGWVEFEVERGRWSAELHPGAELVLPQFRIDGDPRLATGRVKQWVVPDDGGELALEGRWIPESILRVVDAETEEDLSGIEVRQRTSWRAIGKDEIPGDHPKVKPVLENGVSPIRLPALTTMHRTYWVRSPGYAWGRVFFDNETGGERVVELVREAAVSVVTHGSVPEGAKLRLRSQHFAPFHDGEVTLAPEGLTSIGGLRPGRYVISLEVGSFHEITSLVQVGVELVAGAEPRVDLEVDRSLLDRPLSTASGTLRIPAGHTAADYSLSLQLDPGTSEHVQGRIRMVEWEVDEEDSRLIYWRAEDVAPGIHTVFVLPVYHRLRLEVPEEGLHEIEWELPEAAIAEIVFFDTDAPGGLRPEGLTWQDGRLEGFRYNQAPDVFWDRQDQCYRVETVAGEIDLSIQDSVYGNKTKTLTLEPGVQRVEIELERPTRITVSFYDGEAQLAEVNADLFWGIALEGPSISTSGSSDSKSRTFYLEAGGTYRLSFPHIDGFEPIEPQEVDVVVGENTDVRVFLSRSSSRDDGGDDDEE